jgi:uncharacterized membrane protein YedE/YeeE
VAALAGGMLIGLSAVLLLGFAGRIAGISGIAVRLFPPYEDKAFAGRLAFILGLIAAPLLAQAAGIALKQTMPGSPAVLALAGLLVGFGSVWGSGCTSGHAVCGISRLSLRSIVATLTFMATGFLTVFVVRHLLGM